jgi:uncharacterized damage-inducible protein DinB
MRAYVLALSLVAASMGAQVQQGSVVSGPGVAAAKANWMDAHNYIERSAQMLPDSLFSWSPIAGVRTFAQLFGHIAGSEMMFCADVTGDKAKEEDAIEKTATTKTALVAALKEAATYCQKAYSMTDAQAAGTMQLFGRERTKVFALVSNATHDWEHYGNLVTYLRMKGMVPPSSQ